MLASTHRAAALAAAALAAAALAWLSPAAPAGAVPGDHLAGALRWLRAHPFLGPARLAPVQGLGTVLTFDAWQAGRLLPGGTSVRLFLEVPEPQPHPPVPGERPDGRVSREILLIGERAPLRDEPPVSDLLARIYGEAVRTDHHAAEPVPLGPDDLASGPALTSLDAGPLGFEWGEARKGARFDYVEARYRGLAEPFGPTPAREVRRTILILGPASGDGPREPQEPVSLPFPEGLRLLEF